MHKGIAQFGNVLFPVVFGNVSTVTTTLHWFWY